MQSLLISFLYIFPPVCRTKYHDHTSFSFSAPATMSLTTFADIVKVKPISSHSYAVNLDGEWAIGTVPNGGYTASVFLIVARTHMQTTHPKRSCIHPINVHLQYPRRTSAGPAIFNVKDVKIGSRISNLHMVISQEQENGKWADEVEGYITMSNLAQEQGLSLDTQHKLYPPSLPVNLKALYENGEDENWLARSKDPFPNFRRAAQHVQFHLMRPSRRPSDRPKSIADQWTRFTPYKKPGRWTNESLGFVCDMFPQIVESYVNPILEETAASGGDVAEVISKNEPLAKFWYPTVCLNLDVKKLLPEEGVDWLYLRVRARQIKNGRLDLDVEVWDADNDLVALSTHTTLIMGTERNTGGSRSKKKENKL
jgi:hypothetical protein